MTAILVPENTPMYVAVSTDVSGSAIDGVAIVGAKVYLTDTNAWYIVDEDLLLATLTSPA